MIDSNYITLAVGVGIVIAHSIHLNLHSKKLQEIREDMKKLIPEAGAIAEVVDPQLDTYVNEIDNVVSVVNTDINKIKN